jgi:hypothetical protein
MDTLHPISYWVKPTRVPHFGNGSHIKWWDPHEFHQIKKWVLERVFLAFLYIIVLVEHYVCLLDMPKFMFYFYYFGIGGSFLPQFVRKVFGLHNIQCLLWQAGQVYGVALSGSQLSKPGVFPEQRPCSEDFRKKWIEVLINSASFFPQLSIYITFLVRFYQNTRMIGLLLVRLACTGSTDIRPNY